MFIDDVRAITSEQEYDAALKAIRPFFSAEPEPGTPEAARFDGLFALISQYEDRRYPMGDATPAAVVRGVMLANNYTRADLVEIVGKSRASDILNGRRNPTLEQIRSLRRAWRIPADALISGLEAA